MRERKVVVPEGMLRAAINSYKEPVKYTFVTEADVEIGLEAALLWLSENPIEPTWDQVGKIKDDFKGGAVLRSPAEWERLMCIEWQRRMFLAPEEEIPEEVKDLLLESQAFSRIETINACILEAYRRGKGSR